MEKNIITLWVNIYKTSGLYTLLNGSIYDTKERAEDAGNCVQGYITTVAVQFEDKGDY